MKKLQNLGKSLTKEQQRQVIGGAGWATYYACDTFDPCTLITSCKFDCQAARLEAVASCPSGSDVVFCDCVRC